MAAILCLCHTPKAPTMTVLNTVCVPLRHVEFYGNRYVVDVDLGVGHPVPLMVHGGANMTLMLNHGMAERINAGRPITKTSDYGYSDKGSGLLYVEHFCIGGRRLACDMDVPVFDQDPTSEVSHGMLGATFLRAQQAILSFAEHTLTLPGTTKAAPDRAVEMPGYHSTPIQFDPYDMAYIWVYFEALGRKAPMGVGTVGDAHDFNRDKFCEHLELVEHPDPDTGYLSPHGTSSNAWYPTLPVRYHIDQQCFEAAPDDCCFSSYSAYMDVPPEAIDTFGTFNFDWMLRHQAVIDYGAARLYFK